MRASIGAVLGIRYTVAIAFLSGIFSYTCVDPQALALAQANSVVLPSGVRQLGKYGLLQRVKQAFWPNGITHSKQHQLPVA